VRSTNRRRPQRGLAAERLHAEGSKGERRFGNQGKDVWYGKGNLTGAIKRKTKAARNETGCQLVKNCWGDGEGEDRRTQGGKNDVQEVGGENTLGGAQQKAGKNPADLTFGFHLIQTEGRKPGMGGKGGPLKGRSRKKQPEGRWGNKTPSLGGFMTMRNRKQGRSKRRRDQRSACKSIARKGVRGSGWGW